MRFPAVAPALTLAVCAALAAVPARAEHRCADPATQEAFLVAALQSNLQVLGVACSDMGRYSQFVDRYRADLVQHGNVMTAWFKKRYGGRANVEAERYSTEMVNAVSTGNNTFGKERRRARPGSFAREERQFEVGQNFADGGGFGDGYHVSTIAFW